MFISHRECGTLVELDSARGRAIGKMRATISQRFRQTVPASAEGETPQEFQYDVECDCRFLFFVERVPLTSSPSRGGSQWKTRFVKLIYEKDRVLPADGTAMPDCLRFAQAELAPYPEGYRFLGAAQARLGYPVEHRLPTPRDNETWTAMYAAMESWLAGEKVELHWAGEGERDIENGLGGEGFEMGNESRTTEMSRGADGVSGEQKENCGQEQSKAIAEDGGVAQPTTAAGVKKASIVNGHANGHCADGHTNGNVAVVVPKDVKVEDLAVQTPPVEVN